MLKCLYWKAQHPKSRQPTEPVKPFEGHSYDMGLISRIYKGCLQIKNSQTATESRYRIRVAISLKILKWSTGILVKVTTKNNLSKRMAIVKKVWEFGASAEYHSAHLGSGLNASTKRLKKTNNEKFWCCVKKLEPLHSGDGSAKWYSYSPQQSGNSSEVLARVTRWLCAHCMSLYTWNVEQAKSPSHECQCMCGQRGHYW